MTKEKLHCECCGKHNNRTKYFKEHDSVLCDSCLIMYKKYPVKYIPPIGEIHYDDEGNILCHICGRGFKKLAGHIRGKHNITTDKYRELYGLNRSSKLTGKNFIPNITVDITTISQDTRFKDNHTKGRNKKRRLQYIKTRTGMKYKD